MGGGIRPGGSKASMKAAAKLQRNFPACEKCHLDNPQLSACRIRIYSFNVFMLKCPREVELEAQEKAQKKVREKGQKKRRKPRARKRGQQT